MEQPFPTRMNIPRGLPPADMHTATANLAVNMATLLAERRKNGAGEFAQGRPIYSGFSMDNMLTIQQGDIVLSPKTDMNGTLVGEAARYVSTSPFAVLNGMAKPPVGDNALDTLVFRGIALTSFTLDAVDIQQGQLAVAIAGSMPFVNRSSRVINEGAELTISVDDCPYIPSYSDQSVYGNSYTRAGNNGMIKKPYFVPFEETVSMVHEGITFEMAKTSIEDRAKVADPDEQFIYKLARAGIDGLARKYKVGIAHSVTGGPILPGYWGQVHLVDHL